MILKRDFYYFYFCSFKALVIDTIVCLCSMNYVYYLYLYIILQCFVSIYRHLKTILLLNQIIACLDCASLLNSILNCLFLIWKFKL